MAVSAIERLWRLSGVVRQLYINYDCDIHLNNLLEDAVKVRNTALTLFEKTSCRRSPTIASHRRHRVRLPKYAKCA